MESLVEAKMIAMVVLAVFSLVLGLLPIWLAKRFGWKTTTQRMSMRAKNILSASLCFGAGVLMCTALTHLLPEVHDGIGELQKEGYVTSRIPLAEILFSAGFFLVYLVEELVHWISDKYSHNKTDVSIHGSVEMRESAVVREDKVVPHHQDTLNDESHCSNICQLHDSEKIKELFLQDSKIDIGTELNIANAETVFVPSENGESRIQNGHHHHYHHALDGGGRVIPSIHGLLVVIGLSLHEVFEGMAVGLETSTADVYTLFAAVASHKFVIIFCVGLDMATSGVKISTHSIYMVVLAAATSLGIGIGIAVSGSGHSDALTLASLVLQGLAGGTLIYVAFFEVLERERSKATMVLLQWTSLFIGFLTLIGLQAIIPGHGHVHGHSLGHSHEHLLEHHDHHDHHDHHEDHHHDHDHDYGH